MRLLMTMERRRNLFTAYELRGEAALNLVANIIQSDAITSLTRVRKADWRQALPESMQTLGIATRGIFTRLLLTLAAVAISVCIPAVHAQSSGAQSPGYDEPFRPQVHFSPKEHWINDPNGLVFFRGEYHLFYQYNPFSDQWGHMSWGHAVTTDLLHWEELPVAIPEQGGVMIFTGSIVIDRGNSSGLCGTETECLVAVYTGSSNAGDHPLQNQNLASSLDNGRTWTLFKGNPVLDLDMADFRDPSVSWDPTNRRWVMSVSLPKEHKVRFYSSSNLKQWTLLSDFGPAGDVNGEWECPDLIRVPSADGKSAPVWALKVGLNPGAPQGGSGEQYFLGRFDGNSFITTGAPDAHGWTNYGKDDYCAISFNGLPKDRKPLLIGWMSNWQYASRLPTSPWRGQMSLPRELSVLRDRAGLALKQEPVVAALRAGQPVPIRSSIKAGQSVGLAQAQSAPFELELKFQNTTASRFGLRLYTNDSHWTEIGFNQAKAVFYIDRTRSGEEVSKEFPTITTAPLVERRPNDLHLVVDRSSIEAYVQGGTIAMTDLIYPASSPIRVEAFSTGESASIKGRLWILRSVWK